jgi:hypothetical protein
MAWCGCWVWAVGVWAVWQVGAPISNHRLESSSLHLFTSSAQDPRWNCSSLWTHTLSFSLCRSLALPLALALLGSRNLRWNLSEGSIGLWSSLSIIKKQLAPYYVAGKLFLIFIILSLYMEFFYKHSDIYYSLSPRRVNSSLPSSRILTLKINQVFHKFCFFMPYLETCFFK